MPMPQLKVRAISASATPPLLDNQPKTGGRGQRRASNWAARPSGSTRGIFSNNPPPVIWASAFTFPPRAAARQLFT